MGLGKSLTAIATLWSFVRHKGSKAVVVCPSSLVDNWEKELKRWLGVTLKPLCVRSLASLNPSADAVVNTFKVGHISMSPVLVISYEVRLYNVWYVCTIVLLLHIVISDKL